jgi:hypothetical protein
MPGGAPLGNHNRLIHGRYSHRLHTPTELRALLEPASLSRHTVTLVLRVVKALLTAVERRVTCDQAAEITPETWAAIAADIEAARHLIREIRNENKGK